MTGRILRWWHDQPLGIKGAVLITAPLLVTVGALGPSGGPGGSNRLLGALVGLSLASAAAWCFDRTVARAARRNRDNVLRLVQGLPLREPPRAGDELGQAGQALVIAGWLLGERQSALARSRAELQRSNRDLERFAYVASHDLKEPLRMIASYVRILREDLADRPDPETERCMGFIEEGAERMERMIDALLAYARTGSRTPNFVPTDLEAVLTECLHDLAPAIAAAQARITADPLPVVLGDPTLLRQLLQNLLSNALKFHGERPPVVHVGARRAAGRWILSVRDEGIGIPQEAQERILGIFERLHTTREYPGTGIGLAICQRIAEIHGGWIRVDSEPGRGSTFHVSLPAASVTADRAFAPAPRPVPAGRSR